MKPLYFIICIGVTFLLFYLLLSSITYTIHIENFAAHHISRYSGGSSKKASNKLNNNKKSHKGNPFKWPTKKENKVHHTHPTLLYYNSNGDILPVKHGHRITHSSVSSGDNNDYSSNTKFMFGQKVNNASYVLKSKKKAKRLNKGEKFHYSMPLPLNDDKEIIDITSNTKYLSPALWMEVDDENAEGYLYPYNIINRFNKNAIDMDMPYGKQVNDKLQDQNPSDLRYFKGIKHTHKRSHKHGLVKEKWHLKKRKKKK